MKPNPNITPRQAAKILECSVRTVYRYCEDENGPIREVKRTFTGRILLKKQEILELAGKITDKDLPKEK